MSSKSKVLGVGLIGVAAVGTWLVLSSSPNTNDSVNLSENPALAVDADPKISANKPPTNNQEQTTPIEMSVSEEESASDWNGAEFAPSLADTDIDGALTVDEYGNLEITINLKDFYDYFFNAVGERTEEEVFAEIEKQIALRLEGEAASQAIALMYDYVEYQKAQQDLMAKKLVAHDLQDYEYYARTMADAFNTLKEFRRQYFSPEIADAFFSLEEIYGEHAVAVLQIQANPSLSDEEKLVHVQTLESQLPDSMKEVQRETDERADLAAKARSIYEQGGSPEEIHELLSDRYEPEVVDNLLEFYAREDKWQARLSEYFVEKGVIMNSGLSLDDQSQAISALKNSMFEAEELNRLGSEEAIAEEISQSKQQQNTSS